MGKVIRPLTAGGDHPCSLPILRAIAEKRPVGMVHFDAHSDLWDSYFGGFKLTHGTPFARAVEEGLIDGGRTIQIGLRGSVYDLEDRDFGARHGVRMLDIEEGVASRVRLSTLDKAQVFAFAGIWRPWTGSRKGHDGEHRLFSFLTAV